MNQHEPKRVVLVDDDPGHARLTATNLRRSGTDLEFVVFDGGGKALDYLQGSETGGGCAVVLLDLNMPGMGGLEFLERLRGDEKTARTPVVVFSTTDDPEEVERCHALGISFFMAKPVDYERFARSVEGLGRFLDAVVPSKR